MTRDLMLAAGRSAARPESTGRAARPGGVHRQQVPAGPGGDPGRPADQGLALRATAERDHHPLPGLTAAGIAATGIAAIGKAAPRAAGQRGGQP